MAGVTPRWRLARGLPVHVVNSVSGMEDTGPLPEDGRPDAEADIRLAVEATRPANTGDMDTNYQHNN